ncbi:MAG: hypothetical protein ACRC9Q_08040 [Bacteroidales bacterium]
MKTDKLTIQAHNQHLNHALASLTHQMGEYEYYAIPEEIRRLCQSKDRLVGEYLSAQDYSLQQQISAAIISDLNHLYLQLLLANDVGLLLHKQTHVLKSQIRDFSDGLRE